MVADGKSGTKWSQWPAIIHQPQLINGQRPMNVAILTGRYLGHKRWIMVVQPTAGPVLDRATLQRIGGVLPLQQNLDKYAASRCTSVTRKLFNGCPTRWANFEQKKKCLVWEVRTKSFGSFAPQYQDCSVGTNHTKSTWELIRQVQHVCYIYKQPIALYIAPWQVFY